MLLALAVLSGKQFTFDPTMKYVGSLIYLAIFGTIVAFGCYLALVGNIGADKAAYATLLFPIVALIISTSWEEYHWTPSAAIGILLILGGNVLMVHKRWQFPMNILRRKGKRPD